MSDRPPMQRRPPRRRSRRRVRINPLLNGVDRVDWKDVDFLREFLGDRARITPRRVNRSPARIQRKIRVAIQRARTMALLPYE